MAGRNPIPFNQEIADEICERIITSRMGLEWVLDSMRSGDYPTTPSLPTIYKWMRENPEFLEESARAREMSADTYVDAALQEAHSSRVGVITTTQEWGEQTKTADNVERSKLIVQTLFKRAGQLNPRKYGDKLDLNHGGTVGVNLINDIPRPKR